MSRRRITMELSVSGIDKAITELEEYKRTLRDKTQQFRQEVGEEIRTLAESGFSSAMVNDTVAGGMRPASVSVEMSSSDSATVVIANGGDAVWVEFGAGVYHNGSVGSSPHPKGAELGMTIGSYGNGRGSRRVWGYYDEGGLVLTRGTPAQMPMYSAAKAECEKIDEIARRVFGA